MYTIIPLITILPYCKYDLSPRLSTSGEQGNCHFRPQHLTQEQWQSPSIVNNTIYAVLHVKHLNKNQFLLSPQVCFQSNSLKVCLHLLVYPFTSYPLATWLSICWSYTLVYQWPLLPNPMALSRFSFNHSVTKHNCHQLLTLLKTYGHSDSAHF